MFRLIKKLLGVGGIVLTLLISTAPSNPVSAQDILKNWATSELGKLGWALKWSENCQLSGYWTKVFEAQKSLLAVLNREDRRTYLAGYEQHDGHMAGSIGCSEEKIDRYLNWADRMTKRYSEPPNKSGTRENYTNISAVGSDLLPSDEKVCANAINPSDPDRWSKIPEKQSYVKQAQNRGYSSDQCHFMVQGQPASDCPDGSSDNGKGQCSVNRIDSTVPKRPTGTKTEKRPIALHWEGKNQLMLGEIELPVSGANGKVSFNLPDNSGKCSGTFSFKDRSSGVWAAACSTEETLSGSFISTGQGGAITGTGTDSRGNAVKFTIGQR